MYITRFLKSVTGRVEHEIKKLRQENEEYCTLAENRLKELNQMQNSLATAIKQQEQLRLQMKHLPTAVVWETPEYKGLETHFALICEELSKYKALYIAECDKLVS